MIYGVSQMTNEIIQYTEEQVKSLTNQELVNEILKYDVKFTHLSRYLKKNEQILLVDLFIAYLLYIFSNPSFELIL